MEPVFVLKQPEIERLIFTCESHGYGQINRAYLARSMEVLYGELDSQACTCAIRTDLRFAAETLASDVDSLVCLQRSDPAVITRFFQSLKSQLYEEHYRQQRYGAPWLFRYIWCREKDTGLYPHYHLVLFFNKDHYAYLGDYNNPDANNMATRIQKAWCSALGLPYPHYAHLVHFPENRMYWISRSAANNREQIYADFLFRLAYLSKVDTKDINDGQRNFGCSQQKYSK